ncbi:uncharacterized protein [Henckelia pumila]|uniref:uncharacterized protein n=1 Tax=Henckelia pumila TaxID=405737 RepID=UPI003C6E523C
MASTDRKHLLHELLKENQEPFRLKNYIAERRSQLKNPSHKTTVLQIKNKKPIESTCFAKPGSLCKHACFLSFQNSPDVIRSPFPSPLKSPCKSPRAAVFLHVPSRTAAMLVEAAMRIQKQQQSKNNKPGFALFGSLLKRLKDRSKNMKRAIGNDEIRLPTNRHHELMEENARISCSCDNRAAELEASTSSTCGYRSLEEMVDNDFISEDLLFCESPFRFSLRRSPSCTGSPAVRTPEFCSPAASPRLPATQEKDNNKSKSPKTRNGEEDDEEKEHCSPVSILDPPFQDEDGHESEEEAEEEDGDCDGSSYANVQRAKQQLLYRLRRFEKLAELDPVELERKMLDSSDEEFDQETVTEPDQDDDPLSRQDTFLMSINLKNLVTQPVVKEKGKNIGLTRNKEVVFGRIFNRLGSWKEVEFDTIDRMIGMDFKMDFDGWKGFQDLVDDIAVELELELFGMLVEELHGEMFCMDHGCT